MSETIDDATTSPVRQLLADRTFRRFWIAQVLYTATTGTLRFTFVWLIVTLTEWPSAEGLVAIALGLPAMLLSVPAGAWSDRVDRKRLFVTWTAATVAALAAFTAVIALGQATPIRTGVAALVLGAVTAINLPNIQAMVPLLVPPERLMNAAALQNGGGQAAGFAGLAVGGLAIGLLGDAGGFALLTVVAAVSLALMLGVDVPAAPPVDGASGAAVAGAEGGTEATPAGAGGLAASPGVEGGAEAASAGTADAEGPVEESMLAAMRAGARFG
ncbi:MAG: MFS transporter, partial [Actinomycetota bacterium]